MTIDERLEFLTQSVESHDRRLGELTDKMATLTTRFDGLTGMMEQLPGAMKTLAEAVHSRSRRRDFSEDHRTARTGG
jgi:hypothetical protein